MVTVEWTAGALTAAKQMKAVYGAAHPDWAQSLQKDIDSMRAHAETLKVVRNGVTAYAYSSAYGETGHGWRAAGKMPSTASTGWMAMVDAEFNPFFIGGKSTAAAPAATTAPAATPTKSPGFTGIAALAAALGVGSLFAAFRKKQAATLEVKAENDQTNDGGLPVVNAPDAEDVGGIDMRMMPMMQQGSNPALGTGMGAAAAATINPVPLRKLDAQWQAIVEQVNQGVVPCKQLQAYMAACATNPQAQDQRKQAEQYLAWVLRMEEDAGVSISAEMQSAFCGA
jgi:hypothetical protein